MRDFSPAHVRFGSKGDITVHRCHVRFTPESGQTADISVCPLCAVPLAVAVRASPGLAAGVRRRAHPHAAPKLEWV
jgi:hypothetical protein